MLKVVATEYQNIMDLSIQECGGIESMFDFALLNECSVTDLPEIGTSFRIPTEKTQEDLAVFFRKKHISIATSKPQSANVHYAVPSYVKPKYWK